MPDHGIHFIHIPKNAGTSIQELTKRLGDGCFLSYHGHGTHPTVLANQPDASDQLIILRDPIDRFCSAVRYGLQEAARYGTDHGDDEMVQQARGMGINEFVESLRAVVDSPPGASLDARQRFVVSEVLNTEHRVGPLRPEWKWTFCTQLVWYAPGQRVALFDSLQDDFELLFRSRGQPPPQHVRANTTPMDLGDLNAASRAWLSGIYRHDVDLYHRYKGMGQHQRLGLTMGA
mmetsp:Transcript_8187/g.19978  ORF Transcript_8187/g.19978 Transcript_8187/m.19978 type:complete len:232 (+) Transcript_8187:1709-2404(+)